MELDSLAESATNICTWAGATAVFVLVSVVMAEGKDCSAGRQLVVQCFAIVEVEKAPPSSSGRSEELCRSAKPLNHEGCRDW